MCEMYGNELKKALNPMSAMTVPAVIATLRNTLNFLEKAHPSALEMATDIQKNAKCDFAEISFCEKNRSK